VKVIWLRKQQDRQEIENALWTLRRNANALHTYFDKIEPRSTLVLNGIDALAITVAMKLRENDIEGAREAVEEIGSYLDEIKATAEKATDPAVYQLFGEMQSAFKTLQAEVKNVLPAEEGHFRSSIQDLILIVQERGPQAFRNFRQAVQNLKELVGGEALTREIAYLERDVEILADALRSGKVEKIQHWFAYNKLAEIIYEFLYEPLMRVLPEEKRQVAQTHFQQIFASISELEIVVNAMKNLQKFGVRAKVYID
jgi:hypothetical protein